MGVVLVSVLFGVTGIQAGTSVDWGFGWGVYQHGAPDLTDGTAGTTAVAASQPVLWQLVVAGTAIDPVDPFNPGAGYVGGDDMVLASRITPAGGGGGFGEWLTGTAVSESSTSYAGQLAFIRVFQSATAVGGEWYYDSPTIVLNNIDTTDPLRLAQTLEGNTDVNNQGNALNMQIVPEPSTVALVLLGLGIVGYRRFKNA
jgi:hypothetical protein